MPASPPCLQRRGRTTRRVLRPLIVLSAVVACLFTTTPMTLAEPAAPTTTKMTFTAPPGSALCAILDRGYIRVGVKYDIPTFGVRNVATGKVVGFEPELARYIASALFGDPNRVKLPEAVNNNRIPFLQANKFDLVISQLTITPTRAKQVSFSDVYYRSQLRLVAQQSEGITDLASLAGKQVCVTPGSTAITELATKAPQAQIVTMAANSQCFDAVRDGRVDVMGGDLTTMAGFLARDPALTLVGSPLASAPYGVGIKKGNEYLTAAVNQIIARFKQDGSWQRSYNHWVKPVTGETMTPPSAQSGIKAASGSGPPSGAGALVTQLRHGLRTTVTLVAGAYALALVLGVVLASLRSSRSRLVRGIAMVPTEYFRNTPLLVLMYLFTSGLAKAGVLLTPFTAAMVALGLYTSGYVAEIVRSGFATIHPGQRQAADSLGLAPLTTLRLVVLPQALRSVTGPLGTQLVLTIKNSSVAAAIAVTGLLAQAQNYNALTFQTAQAFLGVALAYLILTVPISLLSNWTAGRVRIAR